MERRLLDEGAASDELTGTLAALDAEGLLDDEQLAEHYLEARSARLGHGAERLVRELVARGVEESTANAAWRRLVDEGRVQPEDALERLLERFAHDASPDGRLDLRQAQNVVGKLRRRGHELSRIMPLVRPRIKDDRGEPRGWMTDESD